MNDLPAQRARNEAPYQAPEAALGDDAPNDSVNTHPLALTGRLGRLHYVLYSLGSIGVVALLGGLMFLLIAGFGQDMPLQTLLTVLALLGAVTGLAVFVMQIIWARRRCHDLGASGWLAVIAFIPLLNLVLWFFAGTAGANRFGGQPPQPATWTLIIGCVPVMIGGVAMFYHLLRIFSLIALMPRMV